MKYYSEILDKLFDTEEALKMNEAFNKTFKKSKDDNKSTVKEEDFKAEVDRLDRAIKVAEEDVIKASEMYKTKIKEADEEVKKLFNEYETKATCIYNKLITEGTPVLDEANNNLRELRRAKSDFLEKHYKKRSNESYTVKDASEVLDGFLKKFPF